MWASCLPSVGSLAGIRLARCVKRLPGRRECKTPSTAVFMRFGLQGRRRRRAGLRSGLLAAPRGLWRARGRPRAARRTRRSCAAPAACRPTSERARTRPASSTPPPVSRGAVAARAAPAAAPCRTAARPAAPGIRSPEAGERQAAVGAQRLYRALGDRAAQRSLREAQRVGGRHALSAAHDVAQRRAAQLGRPKAAMGSSSRASREAGARRTAPGAAPRRRPATIRRPARARRPSSRGHAWPAPAPALRPSSCRPRAPCPRPARPGRLQRSAEPANVSGLSGGYGRPRRGPRASARSLRSALTDRPATDASASTHR